MSDDAIKDNKAQAGEHIEFNEKMAFGCMNYKMIVALNKYEDSSLFDERMNPDKPSWASILERLGNIEESWIKELYEEICKVETASYKNNVEKFLQLDTLTHLYALFHVKLANNKFNEGKFSDAFELMSDALNYIGYCEGIRIGSTMGVKESINAMKKSDKRHAENRAMKEEVFKWLDKSRHNYKSLNAACMAIVTDVNLVPLPYETIRKWATEWNKNKKKEAPKT